jgi:hypothetical protein
LVSLVSSFQIEYFFNRKRSLEGRGRCQGRHVSLLSKRKNINARTRTAGEKNSNGLSLAIAVPVMHSAFYASRTLAFRLVQKMT